MAAIQWYEKNLFGYFVAGLLAVPGLTFYGIQDPHRFHQRTPTAAFTLAGRTPQEVAEGLSRKEIYVWAGNFYAVAVTERLGLEKTGAWFGRGWSTITPVRRLITSCNACGSWSEAETSEHQESVFAIVVL